MVNKYDLIQEAVKNGMDKNEAKAKVDALIESIEAQGEDISIMESAKAWLNNLTTTVNSIVENPAQPSNWTLFKSADGDIKVKKLVFKEEFKERQIAFAPALVPGVIDKQGDVIDPITIEETAWKFLEEFGEVDTDHDLKLGKGIVVESWVSKVEEEYDRPDGETETYPKGTWMLGIKVPDEELWEKIKRGKYEGLSIFGEGDGIELGKSLTDYSEEELREALNKLKDNDNTVKNGDNLIKGEEQYSDEDIMTDEENEDEEVEEEQHKEATNGQILDAINDLKDTMKELLTNDSDEEDDDEEKGEEPEEEEVQEEEPDEPENPESLEGMDEPEPNEKMKFTDGIRKELLDDSLGSKVKTIDYGRLADEYEAEIKKEREKDE